MSRVGWLPPRSIQRMLTDDLAPARGLARQPSGWWSGKCGPKKKVQGMERHFRPATAPVLNRRVALGPEARPPC